MKKKENKALFYNSNYRLDQCHVSMVPPFKYHNIFLFSICLAQHTYSFICECVIV